MLVLLAGMASGVFIIAARPAGWCVVDCEAMAAGAPTNVTLRRRRQILMVGSIVLALLVLEIGLRNIGGVFHDTFIIPDPIRGWALRPGYGGWVADENTFWMAINSDGLRDREHDLVTPVDTVRVAVLGDSYMEGVNVTLDKTFPSFLEAGLGRCLAPAGMKAETINFGVSAYGTAQEWLTFRHHAVKYRPAVVLLAFFTGNDIEDNSPALDSSPRPYFDVDRGTLDSSAIEPVVVEPWWRAWRIVATDHSRVLQLLYEEGWGRIRPYLPNPPEDGRDAGFPGSMEDDEQIYRPPATPELTDGWRNTEALLLMLAQEVRAAGAEFWIVTLANEVQVNPDLVARERTRRQIGVDSLFYPDERIRDFAEGHGIRVVTLAPALADYTAAHRTYLNGGYNARVPFGAGHWNEVGNHVAADMVSARLCADSPVLQAARHR